MPEGKGAFYGFGKRGWRLGLFRVEQFCAEAGYLLLTQVLASRVSVSAEPVPSTADSKHHTGVRRFRSLRRRLADASPRSGSLPKRRFTNGTTRLPMRLNSPIWTNLPVRQLLMRPIYLSWLFFRHGDVVIPSPLLTPNASFLSADTPYWNW